MIDHRLLRQRDVLIAVAAGWIGLMALLVWLHARESTQPPIYDAFGYYSKAKHVWDELLSGGLPHLLDAEPGFRPPATVLMSFPFGFAPTFNGFYFRSVFFAIALVVLATILVPWRPDRDGRVLLTATSAAFLTTLSLFYYFEPYAGGPPMVAYWGLVDNFLTGLAAFGAACATRSFRNRSVAWGLASTVVGVLMIYVKPSGALVAALVASTLVVGWVVGTRRSYAAGDRRPSKAPLVILVVAQVVLLGGAVLLALESSYLGAVSMAYGSASLAVMRSELQIDLPTLLGVIRGGLGPFIPLWIVCAAAVFIRDRFTSPVDNEGRSVLDNVSILAGAVVFVAGAWFWLVASGGQTQIRYFTPFLYASIVFALGPLLAALARRSRWAVGVAIAFMLGAVVNTVLLLALPNPSLQWQTWSGVNVMSHSKSDSIAQARTVIDRASGQRPVIVYSMAFDLGDAMFESVFHLQMLRAPEPQFVVRRPVDWQRPSMYRRDEIIACDYILFDPRRGGDVGPATVLDFDAEQVVFQKWVMGLTAADGVELRSVSTDSVLLQITDRLKLLNSMNALIRSHNWRPLFIDTNPPDWWSEDAVGKALQASEAAIENVRFGDKFELRAATLSTATDKSLRLYLWIRLLQADDNDGWVVLVHPVDAEGKILTAPDITLGVLQQPGAESPYRFVEREVVLPPGSMQIALGFYRASTLLIANRGQQDWGGKRILLPLPPVVDSPTAR